MRARARRGPTAVLAGIAVLGVGLLSAGAIEGAQGNAVQGTPIALQHQAGPVDVSHHSQLATRTAPTTSAPTPSSAAPAPKPHPSTSSRPAPAAVPKHTAPRPAAQHAGTIRLPHGGTASLVHSQVSADGELAIPDGVSEATWWGASFNAAHGATLFAGHINWAGATGPFAELWNDSVGGVISVRNSAGKEFRYRISKVMSLGKNELPAKAPQLFGQSGAHRAVLVTCGGKWVGGALGYASNRVVVANPIST